jgi:plastocyanin domain-containing protein
MTEYVGKSDLKVRDDGLSEIGMTENGGMLERRVRVTANVHTGRL